MKSECPKCGNWKKVEAKLCLRCHRGQFKGMKEKRKQRKLALNRAHLNLPGNREKHHKRVQKSTWRLKIETIDTYGGKCTCCGEYRYEFLTIDHSKKDGGTHRRLITKGKPFHGMTGRRFYYYLKRNGYPKDLGLQVLCFNCHHSKDKYGYCPHEECPIQ